MAEQNRENERRRRKREEYAARSGRPTRTQAVPADQGAGRRVQVVAGGAAGAAAAGRRGRRLRPARGPAPVQPAGRRPAGAVPPLDRGRAAAGRAERKEFTPTPKQMLYGKRAELARIVGERDAAGRVDGGARRGRVEGARGGEWSRGLRLPGDQPRRWRTARSTRSTPARTTGTATGARRSSRGCATERARNALYPTTGSPTAPPPVDWRRAAAGAGALPGRAGRLPRRRRAARLRGRASGVHRRPRRRTRCCWCRGRRARARATPPPSPSSPGSRGRWRRTATSGSSSPARPTPPRTCCWRTCWRSRRSCGSCAPRSPDVFAEHFDARLLDVAAVPRPPARGGAGGVVPLPKDDARGPGAPRAVVHYLTDAERDRLEAGLRSSERVRAPPLPDPAGERPRRVGAADRRRCWAATTRRCATCVREFERDGLDACLTRGSSRPHTIHAKVDAVGRRAAPGAAAPEPAHVRQADQRLDAGAGRRGQLRRGDHRRAGQRRDDPAGASCGWASAGGGPSSGSPAPTRSTHEKKCARPPDPPGRDPPDLGAGLPGRGLVEPAGPAQPPRLGRGGRPAAAGRAGGRQGRPGPQGAGLLRPAAARGPDRPSTPPTRCGCGSSTAGRSAPSPSTSWTGAAASSTPTGKEALLLIWDNAAWHVSQQVRAWIRDHNRQVKQHGHGRPHHRLLPAEQEPLAQRHRGRSGSTASAASSKPTAC